MFKLYSAKEVRALVQRLKEEYDGVLKRQRELTEEIREDNRRLVDGGIREQTERVIDIIEDILSEVDCTLSDVAQTTVYLASLDDMAAMNEVYARRFSTPAPARAVVGVNELPLGALIEMDCVACR